MYEKPQFRDMQKCNGSKQNHIVFALKTKLKLCIILRKKNSQPYSCKILRTYQKLKVMFLHGTGYQLLSMMLS